MSGLKVLLKGGEKLIKLYRGESKANTTGMGKTAGRWFNPDKNYVKHFTGSEKGQRTLKTVNVTEKDYNIGRKLHDKVYGKKHCQGTDCNVILPKKNLKDVKSRKFNSGGKVKFNVSAQGRTTSSKPAKGVDVDAKSAYGKIGATYTTEGGSEISFDVAKSFDMGKVNFPGGSESWKGSSKPQFFVGWKKKFKYGGLV